MGKEIEIWKNIIGYEGKYKVSNTGLIKSLGRKGSGCSPIDIILSASIPKDKKHYPTIGLCKNSRAKSFMVHRLVALHFVDNPESKPEVNHIDGNRFNNHYSNLEWCTSYENTMHGLKLGIMNTAKGSQKIKCSKLNEGSVGIIKSRLANNELVTIIANEYSVTSQTIYCIKNGTTWKHV